MGYTIYTVTGCMRCQIIQQLMAVRGVEFVEENIKKEGKSAFQKFYAANRKSIFRGPEGVEFPLLTDGVAIRQGIAAAVAYLMGGANLDGLFSAGTLHKEWVDGIHISGGDMAQASAFMEVLRYLKIENNMKLQINTNGLNSALLEQVLAEGLADRIIMDVLGPLSLYGRLSGRIADGEDVKKSIALVAQFSEYKFQTTVAPVPREDGTISYLTAEEVGATAELITLVSKSMKNPYVLKLFRPGESADERMKTIQPMAANDLLPYRTAARKHQVFTEIEKA